MWYLDPVTFVGVWYDEVQFALPLQLIPHF